MKIIISRVIFFVPSRSRTQKCAIAVTVSRYVSNELKDEPEEATFARQSNVIFLLETGWVHRSVDKADKPGVCNIYLLLTLSLSPGGDKRDFGRRSHSYSRIDTIDSTMVRLMIVEFDEDSFTLLYICTHDQVVM